jgi:light-regulated signal transduction histidine kinase (bacteriophytochrome)
VTGKTVDLEICDNEPIHFIGAVQSHGALIALDDQSLIISYASANTQDFVGFKAEAIMGKQRSQRMPAPIQRCRRAPLNGSLAA